MDVYDKIRLNKYYPNMKFPNCIDYLNSEQLTIASDKYEEIEERLKKEFRDDLENYYKISKDHKKRERLFSLAVHFCGDEYDDFRKIADCYELLVDLIE